MNVKHPATLDGRYFVVRGRLWRMADPRLNEQKKSGWSSASWREAGPRCQGE
ncbi:hypothetical protein [Bradyrhizobium frederickii]|uniref:hypothetical protein n=1 Tax=Bradyrhizobium frederickii TaxID=2560054 RepID=UPI00142F659C|nr:hypothetical protein [Bradyrhizobium frederickii]